MDVKSLSAGLDVAFALAWVELLEVARGLLAPCRAHDLSLGQQELQLVLEVVAVAPPVAL